MSALTIGVLILVGFLLLGMFVKFAVAAVKALIGALIFGGLGYFIFGPPGLAWGALLGCILGISSAFK